VDATRRDRNAGGWCDVKSKAQAAGYEVKRYYDTYTGRYFIYAHDLSTNNQQAFFFLNPFAKRNLVLESPHALTDGGSAEAAAKVFVSDLVPRALLVNGAKRCASSAISGCFGSSNFCHPDTLEWALSDTAHATTNLFYQFHTTLNDRAGMVDREMGTPKFAQFHTFGALADSTNQRIILADSTGRTNVSTSASIANTVEERID
jgi:hypothetical protein